MGLVFGSLIVGIITSPFLVYFGKIYLNIRKLDKQLQKQLKNNTFFVPDEETQKLLKEAENLLKNKTK